MPKDKNRTLNPAMAQHKLEKQKSIKKGKAEAATRRNIRLAHRNPDRIQRQIDELKSVEESGQSLRPREKQILEALERDHRAVLKARGQLGDDASKFVSGSAAANRGGYGRGDGILGKRRRDGHSQGRLEEHSDSSDETDEEVRRIPMPRDTPPPIPPEYRRKARGDSELYGPHSLPQKPPAVEAKKIYESAPDIRDLRQEAVSKFIPAAVREKQKSIKGQGKLLEPEEMDQLEKAGYIRGQSKVKESSGASLLAHNAASTEELRLLEEERRFSQELKSVSVEDVDEET